MASVNPLSRELVFKIVYYGPGLGGKTTTLEHIHATAKPDHRGKLVSLATPVDRTLYFDFLPMRLPPIRGMHVRLQLFTVPGQVYFNATRKLVLTGADGVVFVADSQMARADANLESLDNLRDNLADQGRNLNDVPIVFQYNKYDLPDVLSVDELDKLLNRWQAPSLATSARTGLGVYEGLERITHAVLGSFETQMPESVRVAAAASYDPNEEGLAAALRGASQVEDRSPTSGAVFSRVSSSRSTLGSIPPDTGHDEPAPPPIDKAAMRAASLPVTTFPEVPDDGWGTKEKPSILPAPDAPISGRGESRLRGSDLRTSEARSRNRPSVLPPKPYAPLIPHAAPPRAPAGHAPVPPANATTSTTKDATQSHAPAPPANATTSTTKDATQGHAPAPPPNATTSAATKPATTTVVSHAPAPPPNASTAATTASDKAPTTEKTIAGPVKAPTTTSTRVETVPAKPEVVAPKAETAPVRIEIAPKKPEPAAVNIDPATPNLDLALKKPEPSAVKPEPAPLKLDLAPAKPEPAAPKPEPTPVKVEPVQAKPEPAAPKPEPTPVKVEPVQAKPEPPAPKPEPVPVKVEPVQAKPEPAAPEPEPVPVKVEPVQVKPEPPAPKTEPVPVKVEPVQAKPEPPAPKTEPVPVKVEPVQVKPEPPAPKPEPVPVKVEPVQAKPEPPAPMPEPVPVKVEPVQAKPEPPAPKTEPEPVKVEPVQAKPEPPAPKTEPEPVKVEPVQVKPEAAPVEATTEAEGSIGLAAPIEGEVKPFERLDPTQLLSIADLLEPPSETGRQAPPDSPSVKHSVPPDSPAIADLQPASALAALSTPGRPKSIPAEPESGPKAERSTLLELASRNPTTPPSSRTRQSERPSASLAQLAASLTEGPKTEPPGTPRFSTEPRFATISGQTPLTAKELVGREPVDAKRGTVPPAPASSRSTGFSFAELWPEADRAAVRDLETAIAIGRCSEAIDHADTLVSRILMNTATLFGSIDIARDATNMPHLLGIDGRRYLAFRSIVRASRSGAKASVQDALAAYAFAVEVRMARSLIR